MRHADGRGARARASWLEFVRRDQAPIRITAPLSAVTWGNPHGAARAVYQRRTWDVIAAPTSGMRARELTRAMIDRRQRVTLVGYPRRDGAAEMRIETVIAGGKTVQLR